MGALRTVVQADHFHSGDKLIMDPAVQVARFGLDSRCSDASITVAAEDTNVRQIAIQLKKDDGTDVDAVTSIFAYLVTSTAKTAFVSTGGSTGIELGTGGDGAILAIVAKKIFLLTCEADGDIDLKWTDTGTEAAYLVLILPNGKEVISGALTNT